MQCMTKIGEMHWEHGCIDCVLDMWGEWSGKEIDRGASWVSNVTCNES